MIVVVKICKKEVYNSQTLWKEDNFKRRTVINMFKHMSNGPNLRFLIFIQSVCRNFKMYSHILFLRYLSGRYLGAWWFSCERLIRMWVNLWISDHWQVENHKAKVDAIEDMFVNRKKWWNERQCIKATHKFHWSNWRKISSKQKSSYLRKRLIKKMWSSNKI